jgi:chemotaxis signal transduction protein/HPt (histidine-containing phosphotransfer) domain-containing protein
MSEFGDLIPEFVEESLEHLKNIEEDIIIIEQGSADSELINRVFRAVHSIKGGSSFLGLKNIEHLSHKMEDIFNLVRNNEMEFTSEISSKILKSIDRLKDMLEDSEESDSYDISEDLAELKQCLEQKPAAAGKVEPPAEQLTGIEDTPVKIDKETLDDLRKTGKKVYLIQFELKDESLGGKNPLDFFNEIEKTGDILVRNVDMELVLKDENFTGEGIPLSILYATVLERDLVAHIFGIEEDIVKEIKPDSLIEEEVIEDALSNKAGIEVDSYLARKQTGKPEEETAVPLARREEEPDIEIEDAEFAVRDVRETKTPGKGKSEEPVKTIEEPEIPEIIEIEEEEEEEDSDAIKENNEYLTFWVGDEEYGIEITQVHEIVTMHEITPVPSAEDFTRGVLNLRGDIIPVYDFRLRLKFEEKEYTHETVILIVMVFSKRVGVIVDRVSEVIQLTREQVTGAPQMQQIPPNYVIGIGQKDEKFVILLKLKEIFNVRSAA